MKILWQISLCCLASACLLLFMAFPLIAEPLPLKEAVVLALTHATTISTSDADEQRAFAAYREARDQYIPQVAVGSGLGKTWGYPLSLEGSAPSIVNVTAQSALINPALREFVRAAKTEYQASTLQAKEQRSLVIQDAVLSYVELNRWETLLGHLREDNIAALKAEQIVAHRIQEGVDNALAAKQAQLNTARVHLRIVQAESSIDLLREKLSHLTGLPSNSISTDAGTIPPLPEIKQEDVEQEDALVAKTLDSNPAVQAANTHFLAQVEKAKGEHRALWPSIDFASQYALLATFNNYENYFVPGSFQQHNATIGIAMRFPFSTSRSVPMRKRPTPKRYTPRRTQKILATKYPMRSCACAVLWSNSTRPNRSPIWSIRSPSRVCSRLGFAWTQAQRPFTTPRMRGCRSRSALIHCKMPTLNWSGRALDYCG